eukprot:TRINITY_DN11673_c0_g1_i1.p1 TRINITY_DN11673_c0_g1~~TRINITY_DN11673_c0_g1_i1.p1  ORF type:complete len:397 (-),score=78.72 TRINITY_DN11673_c0_g1_i1:69-1166(-)
MTVASFFIFVCLIAFVLVWVDQPYGGVTRVYYIAAVEIEWDYVPEGKNLISGDNFTTLENSFVEKSDTRAGSEYKKTVYRQFTDSSFTKEKARQDGEKHMGLLGPVIYAEVKDVIEVHFMNNASFPCSMHPHGLLYSKESEGAVYSKDAKHPERGGIVQPGDQYHYTWHVPERAGPAPNDPSSILWIYHSHSHDTQDTNAGLVGPIVITRAGEGEDGKPTDVDDSFFVLFNVFDENLSPHFEENTADLNLTTRDRIKYSPFWESNRMHAVNGYLYGNLPLLTTPVGSAARWYVMSLGDETNDHAVHWHGNSLEMNGHRVDVVTVLPGESKTLDMKPDNVGKWLLHTHTSDQFDRGMQALYSVEEK